MRERNKICDACEKNMHYKTVMEREIFSESILADREIQFSGKKSFEKYPQVLRLVKFFDKESGKTFEFLTNMLDADATEIAEIYKKRWQVELFFKMIKQNLKIKTFYGHSRNAVETQIWIALIAQNFIQMLIIEKKLFFFYKFL